MMFKFIYDIFVESIFPIHKEERWIFDANTSDIFKLLPRDSGTPTPLACAIFSYKDERVWRLIWSIKYKKSAKAVALAGYALHRMLSNYSLATTSTTTNSVAENIIVIPMPISKQRRRERGYNQCELMANEIARLEGNRLKKNVSDNRIIVIKDLLIRTRHTSRQTLKDKKDRQETAHDLFAVNEKTLHELQNQTGLQFNDKTHFIIIDDVITTGSTINEAIETMRSAGFTNTWGLSVAH